jgi:hypothetical protein
VGRTPPRMRIPTDVMDDAVQLAGSAGAGSRPTAAGPSAVIVEAELMSPSHRLVRLELCFTVSRVQAGYTGDTADREHG